MVNRCICVSVQPCYCGASYGFVQLLLHLSKFKQVTDLQSVVVFLNVFVVFLTG